MMETTPPPVAPIAVTISPLVRGAAAFLFVAGLAALGLAGWLIYHAEGVVAVLAGLALAINGVALTFLGYSPAVHARAPRHWPTIILVFAASVALEIIKRVL